MKILLFGKNGQVGRRLHTALLSLGEVTSYGSDDINFLDQNSIIYAIKNIKPDIIINAAAYTAVDKAEAEEDLAFAINYEAVKTIADEAKAINAWFVHYSTDYVFDGAKNSPYTEDDATCPISVYGRSKAMADQYIIQHNTKYLILRTSWVYDSFGKNFPKTILALAQKNESLRIINDQIGSPTHASLIANTTVLMLYHIFNNKLNLSGLYNLVSSSHTSWHGFANAVIQEAINQGSKLKCIQQDIIPINTSEYITAATRPGHSKLSIFKLENTFGLIMPKWDLYIPSFIEELKIMGVL